MLAVFIRGKRTPSSSKFAVFGSASFFAPVHVFNYEINEIGYPDSFKLLIAIIPQFIGGLILGYIRIKFGILYSFLFHSSWNFFVLLVVVLSI
ncbi:type II CAAX prenyl endopeptidase Rce1 family protein [Echinicola jeungdonensis]|uniref:Type II CAAX prenyl endopeptidase Rce1 family protein n=1 Tax=Echinicola jeungdonensis TaxID=709343 RepID=A0ABV5J4G4_9BACT